MNSFRKLTWIELKLFLREPYTVILAFVFPIVFLVVLAGVFGNQPENNSAGQPVWRGVVPTDYYVPAYVGLVAASIGLVSIPVHVAAYREQGFLRRLHASRVSLSVFLASQLTSAIITAALSGVVLVVAGLVAYGVPFPVNTAQLLFAFAFGTCVLAALGLFMASFLSTTRAAQSLGLVLFFVMMMLSGTGPPVEVLKGGMQVISQLMPLRYVASSLQDGWFGFGWDATSYGVGFVVLAASLVLSVRLFRWE